MILQDQDQRNVQDIKKKSIHIQGKNNYIKLRLIITLGKIKKIKSLCLIVHQRKGLQYKFQLMLVSQSNQIWLHFKARNKYSSQN